LSCFTGYACYYIKQEQLLKYGQVNKCRYKKFIQFLKKPFKKRESMKMIIIMEPEATHEQIDTVLERIQEIGLNVQINKGSEQVVLGLIGDTQIGRAHV